MPEEFNKHLYCPLRAASLLESKIRRHFHNPNKILEKYVAPGITALDIGCGPGVFSLELAKLVGATGKVVSVDMQQGMLDIIAAKIKNTEWENIITLHKCGQETIAVNTAADFVLMFYMVHEVPSKDHLFNEILPLIKQDGLLMIAEPKVVPQKDFDEMVAKIKERRFTEYDKPKIFFSRSIVLKKHDG
jgi:ubiquinone/menaquinone biosynthesis C-methylase UbiE